MPSTGPGSGDGPEASRERRRNVELREFLDELLALVRQLARRGTAMTPGELEYAQQRLEWLSDEIWAAALDEGGDEQDVR